MANEKRLIDANALIERLNAHKDLFISAWSRNLEISPEDKARVDELGMCIAEVFNAPTVDAVEVVHGQWVTGEKGKTYCGRCRVIDDYASVHNYCPFCGVKMDLED